MSREWKKAMVDHPRCCAGTGGLRRLGRTVRGLALLTLLPASLSAQQFNTDNYLAMPHGTVTTVLTVGTEWSMWNASVGLFENWEFFAGATQVWEDRDAGVSSHFTASTWVKYMFYENETRDAGFAVSGGIGANPGYLDQERRNEPYRQFWIIPQGTLRFLSGRLLWDLNPGIQANFDTDPGDDDTAWGFTYSTRAALYGVIPSTAIVAEVFGATGELDAPAQYKAGVRWEPNPSFVLAITWGWAFDGHKSAGLEAGMMIFSPRFACLGGCEAGDGEE